MQDPVPGTFPLVIDPIRIMNLSGAVQREAEQEMVFRKKFRPTFIDQISVGLKGIIYLEFLKIIYFDEFYKSFIKIDSG